MVNENNLDNINNTNEIVKKKRGRKPKNLYYCSNNFENTETSKLNSKIINIDDNILPDIIAYLPLKNNDLLKKLDNNIVEKLNLKLELDVNNNEIEYESANSINNCEYCKKLEDKIIYLENLVNQLKEGIIIKNENYNKKLFLSQININNLENKDSLCCWWCCHKFNNHSLGLPEFIFKNIYYVYGNFCSFNCMLSYNLDKNDYKIWERQANIYQMINSVSDEIKTKKVIFAPPRQTLNIFGGPLTINEFRNNFLIINNDFRYILPPMISLIGLIEENIFNLGANNQIKEKPDSPYIHRKKPLPNKNMFIHKHIN